MSEIDPFLDDFANIFKQNANVVIHIEFTFNNRRKPLL
jgi:hypothetical protein